MRDLNTQTVPSVYTTVVLLVIYNLNNKFINIKTKQSKKRIS